MGGSRFAAELLNPSSAARLAASSWRRLHDYLIPLERLQEFDTPEPVALHGWCVEFARRCASLHALDEARLAHWAHEAGFIPAERLVFAGFDVVPPAMARLLRRWADQGQVVDAPGLTELDPTQWEPAESGSTAAGSSESGSNVQMPLAHEVAVLDAPDHDAELLLAAAWARDRVREGARNVAVIVPDLQHRREEVQRLFEDTIAPGRRHIHAEVTDLPVTVAAPSSLGAHPMVDAAILVLQLAAGNASSQLVGRLLRSPFIVGAEAERGRRAIADFRLREQQRDRWDWPSLERWAGMRGCEELQLAARALNAVLRGALGSTTASRWAERFHQWWSSVGWPGRSRDSTEQQTWDKFYGLLSEFGALDAVAGKMSLRRAIARLQDLLNDTPFEPKTRGAAITVIDPATSSGMRFEALWVSGLHADRWPAAVNPDPLLPLELQRAARIPEASAATLLQLATRQLQRWQGSADRLVLSWPRRDGDIALIRSPLLDTVRPVGNPPAIASVAKPLRRVIFDTRPVLEMLVDDRAPPLPRQAARGGARILELQSHCPFRAQAELRLRARPVPKVSLGVEPMDRGKLLHEVLEETWGALQTQERLLAGDPTELEFSVRECTQRLVASSLAPDTPQLQRLAQLEADGIVREVMQLLTQERARPPFKVRRAERAETYAIGGLSITLRPDRIDELAGGGELLIDYKLGASHKPRDWFDVRPGRPLRPQLPLYALAHADSLKALAYVVLAPGTVEYRGWSDGVEVGAGVTAYPRGMRIDLGDPADWESLMHHWRFTLTRLAERYVAGDATVDPLPLACAHCHLSTLCRVHEAALDPGDSEAGNDDQ